MGVLAQTQVSPQYSALSAQVTLNLYRRADPPTEKEVLQSLALGQMKKINAAKLEEQRRAEMMSAGLDPSPPGIQDHEKTPYPKYSEYEIAPGDSGYTEKDKWEKFKNPYDEPQKK